MSPALNSITKTAVNFSAAFLGFVAAAFAYEKINSVIAARAAAKASVPAEPSTAPKG